MVIGISGAVGAGKSTILNILKEEYSAKLLVTDDIAKHLMKPGKESYNLIVKNFGPEILDGNGDINNTKLADIVFNDPVKLSLLNSLTHPQVIKYVKNKIDKFYKENPNALIVVETALLFDCGLNKICDYCIAVTLNEKCRIKRLAEERGYSEEKVKSVLGNQRSDAELSSLADFVIDNSGSIEDTKFQIKRFFNERNQDRQNNSRRQA